MIDRLTFTGVAEADHIDLWSHEMSSQEPWITLGRTREMARAILADPVVEAYQALMAGRPAGLLLLRMDGVFKGYIQSLLTLAPYRGRGVGRAMIRFAEERIFRDSPSVFICVSSFNPRARSLYERLGYRVVGELKDWLVSGESEILLHKAVMPWREFRDKSRLD